MTQPRSPQIKNLKACWSSYTFTATGGTTSTVLPGGFQAATVTQVNGGNTTGPVRGIITTGLGGYCKISSSLDSSSLDNGGQLFGRLTYSAGNYTLTYKLLTGGTEVTTALPGAGSISIRLLFPEVMEFGEVPADSLIIQESSGPANPAPGAITGDLVVPGNTTLGDSTADIITTNARLASNLNPNTDNTRSLGSSTLRFSNLNSTEFVARGDNTNSIYTNYDSNGINAIGTSFTIDGPSSIEIGTGTATNVEISRTGQNTTVSGDLSIEEELDVVGDASFSSEVVIQDNLTVNGDLSVFTNDVNVIGTLTAGNLSFTNLVVTGNTTLGDASSDTVTLNANTTVQAGAILETTGTGNINLPNNGSARFQIEGVPVDGYVTSNNLIELTNGSVTNLHSHPGGGGGIEYFAGDGLNLNTDTFNIDLTDTTIFTTSGISNRALVLSDSSGNSKATVDEISVDRISAPGSLEIEVPDGNVNRVRIYLGDEDGSVSIDEGLQVWTGTAASPDRELKRTIEVTGNVTEEYSRPFDIRALTSAHGGTVRCDAGLTLQSISGSATVNSAAGTSIYGTVGVVVGSFSGDIEERVMPTRRWCVHGYLSAIRRVAIAIPDDVVQTTTAETTPTGFEVTPSATRPTRYEVQIKQQIGDDEKVHVFHFSARTISGMARFTAGAPPIATVETTAAVSGFMAAMEESGGATIRARTQRDTASSVNESFTVFEVP